MAAQPLEPRSVTLREYGQLIETLWDAVDHGSNTLNNIPGLVRRVLKTGAWRERIHRGKLFRHRRFLDFITTKPLAGCGWPPDKVEALIKDDAETFTLWREAVTGERHIHHTDNDNVIITNDGQGNGRSYTLSRLKRTAPELFRRVVAGELSAHAAAIKAGFRRRTLTVPADPEAVVRAIRKHFTAGQVTAIRNALENSSERRVAR